MATKAEKFRARKARDANPPKPKRPPRPKRNVPVDTAKPGVSASKRKVGAKSTAKRNAAARVADKGGPVLETSATGRPSRKSSRKTTKGAKPSSSLERRAIRKAHSPIARATKAAAGNVSARKTAARKPPTRKQAAGKLVGHKPAAQKSAARKGSKR